MVSIYYDNTVTNTMRDRYEVGTAERGIVCWCASRRAAMAKGNYLAQQGEHPTIYDRLARHGAPRIWDRDPGTGSGRWRVRAYRETYEAGPLTRV